MFIDLMSAIIKINFNVGHVGLTQVFKTFEFNIVRTLSVP